MKKIILLTIVLIPLLAWSQPEIPVDKWSGKTIMLIAAHPDDDARSHGTLAMLQDHGNDIYIVLITSGNVGTKDPDVSRTDLAKIRMKEEINALSELGIPAENYINLGYTDGMLEYEPRREVAEKLVRLIRKYKPDVLMAYDPGKGIVRWHKADHRSASHLAVDACRAAEWHLLFPGQIINEGLEAHAVGEYLLFDGFPETYNTFVDVTEYADKRIGAALKYVSQWSSGNKKYSGAELTPEEEKQLRERWRSTIYNEGGKVVEQFRYYKGIPDGIGR